MNSALGAAAMGASGMGSSFEKQFNNEVKGFSNVIGGSSAQSTTLDEINWHDYNYPPGLRLIHYDPEELPSVIVGMTWRMKINFELTASVLIMNMLNTFIIMITEGLSIKVWIYSILNLLILGGAALFVFYQGYRGLAMSSSGLLTQYKAMQVVSLIFLFIFAIFPWGPINGWGRFGTDAYEHAGGKTWWGICTVVEASIFTVNFALGLMVLLQVQNYNVYAAGSTAS